MADSGNSERLLPSVYDRLIDLDPMAKSEAPKSQGQVIHEVKLSLRRDLENLLNTRWSCTNWPPEYEELDLSLINYGIPDFTGINMGSPDNQRRLVQIVTRAIEIFEPRLIKFSIDVQSKSENLERLLSFRVDGLLRSDPYPEQVVFDTSLNVHSSEFEVTNS